VEEMLCKPQQSLLLLGSFRRADDNVVRG